ncbi:ABC-type uncharacterized transport system involved in gliding motility auxiliary subunit [Geothermobacter ehrlichii]|uniref:ABC-type uncharacterized transport system involved in gliding motility auxiliary subunit n=1 Tax=Geothermobacter ehrlichii TaxID=213224 RepID=A0A5D3WH15_9BACT|nr:Gldg family protein [Geothermobacter ehrlichii]TYO98113.1 ABC-type uncharacterized transport system involved in gliding motility auxiliary subunit [Geothermobacter ehrlichii]
MTHQRLLSRSGLLIALLLFVLLNLAAAFGLRGWRIDLTEQHLNTLSQGTRNILAALDKPVTLRLYLSRQAIRKAPGLATYADRVTSLLDEYAALAGDNIRLQRIDPEPFSEAEDDAVRFGLQGIPLGDGAENLYFGLVGELDGRHKTIPFFQPERERFLEYDLTQLIYQLAHPKRLVVGILSGAPIDGGFSGGMSLRMQPPWLIVDQLRQQFEVRMLPKNGEPVPEEVDVLMLVHPAYLEADALYAADQFILRGGKALVFADPLSEASIQGDPGRALSPNEDFERMLASWGVRLEKGKVVGDLAQSLKVNYQGRRSIIQVNYLPWLNIGPASLSEDDVVTSQLGNITMATAGALSPVEGARTTFTPLVRSSDEAMLIDAARIAFAPDPAGLLADFKPAGESFVLAARISGEIESAFVQGPPKQEKEKTSSGKKDESDKEKKPEHLSRSKGPVHLIVVADSDLLQDKFWVQSTNFFGRTLAIPTAANADLVANALEALGGSPDLISVRSRGSYQRPFTLLAELQRKAEMRFRAKEQELSRKLRETESRLNELQRKRQDSGSTTLTPEQEREVEKFLAEKVRIRKQLRQVQYQLRADIEELETTIKAFNIGLVPGLLTLVAFVAWILRRSRE